MSYTNLIKYYEDFPISGIHFRDLCPIFADPDAMEQLVSDMLAKIRTKPTKLVLLDAKGIIVGSILASRLHCGIVLARKAGKLPGEVYKTQFDLEYKSGEKIEIQRERLSADDVVLIHDDFLATGGTARAAMELCKECGVKEENISFCFLCDIVSLHGDAKLSGRPWFSAIHFE